MTGILAVSHSTNAAKGIAEIASQMSGGAEYVKGVGGTEDDMLGNSVPKILDALTDLLTRCDGVVMIPDLGSAVLSCETTLEMLDDADKARVMIADAPILEGAMMAAVEASIGSDLQKVCATAEEARDFRKKQ